MTISNVRESRNRWEPPGQFGAAPRRPMRGTVRAPDPAARAAWSAAARDRDALQERIVSAVRQHLEDGGPGPSEFDLLMFARTAIREEHLARVLAATSPLLVARRR